MSVFVEITPDPFSTSFRNHAAQERSFERDRSLGRLEGNQNHVRRPVRGIQIKNDTYATIEVRKADGRTIPLVDAGGAEDQEGFATTERYSNFLIQSLQESRQERHQIVQTFGEPFVFFFGEHPRVVQASGVLLNTEDFNWRAEWWENYERYLRGTKGVQNRTRVILSWDDIVVEGYILQSSASESSAEPYHVQFTFQLLLTNYQNVSRIGFSEFPINSFEISLDPEALDTTGLGLEPFVSDTQEVRRQNINTEAMGAKNSLLASLRSLSSGSLIEVNGQLQEISEVANTLMSGRRVRVPTGFAGTDVFDREVQLAFASLDPESRNIQISRELAGRELTLNVRSGKRTIGPVKYGKIRDNVDEYVAHTSQPSSYNYPAKLTSKQKASASEAEDRVKEAFEEFGVEVEPSRDINLSVAKAVCQFAALPVGIAASRPETGAVRSVTNIII